MVQQHIFMVIQVILLIALSFGSYYGRKLNMWWHHRLIYGVLGVQLFVFVFWMGPSVLFWNNETGITPLLAMHISVGSISFLFSAILAGVFLARSNSFDLTLLRWTKPLMVASFVLWIISFILGFMFYLDVHIFG